jgi:hypothetical protein
VAGLKDLAATIEATRASVEAVAGPINSSRGQAEHTVAALGELGVEGVSTRLRQTMDRIDEAESIRASLQGALVKANFQVMSAIHGTMGPGARGSTSSVIDNKDGTTSWHGTVDGVKTEIVYGHRPELGPRPSGEELLEPRRPKNQAAAFLQTMVREDATDPAKSVGNAMDPLGALFNREAPPAPASSSTTAPESGKFVEGAGWIAEIRQPAAEVRAEPIPTMTTGNLLEMAVVTAAVMMKTGTAVTSKIDNLRTIAKERRRDGD